MSYKLIVQQETLDDLQEAFDYYEAQQSQLGTTFILSFQKQAQLIEQNPHLFQVIYRRKRRAMLKKFQYHIIYEIEENTIRISAVIHSSRHPKRWQKRR